ncbi:hypothetical protein OROHE_020668 [Orobanche hederae]
MNLTSFYHNAPTRDIRLFMQSFSNEQSPNEPHQMVIQDCSCSLSRINSHQMSFSNE